MKQETRPARAENPRPSGQGEVNLVIERLGAPTWRLPKLRREQDGAVMAGWLRLAVAVKLDRTKGDSDAG